MEILFTVHADDLNRAIGVASIVTPQVTPQTGGGYLFMVRNDTCTVYSRDGKHEARSSFPIEDVTGEGAFILPASAVSGLAYVTGLVRFKATEENGAFKVRYTFGESGFSERPSFDPRSMHNFEKDITAAQSQVPKEFAIKVLQFALATAKSFLPRANDIVDQEVFKTVKIFGSADPELARANGYLLASNGREICYVQCGAFLDKDLSLPTQHLGLIESFLGRSQGVVSMYQTDTKVYVINQHGDVLGWPRHTVEYKKFTYYAKTDEVVASVSPSEIGQQLKLMRANLSDKDKTKIRMHFDPATNNIWFSNVEEATGTGSLPVGSERVETKVTEPLAMNVNVNQMLHMFEGIRGDRVEFRIKILAPDERRPKARYMFRTIDEFLLSDDGTVVGGLIDNPTPDAEYPPKGAHECRVTRFAPGID